MKIIKIILDIDKETLKESLHSIFNNALVNQFAVFEDVYGKKNINFNNYSNIIRRSDEIVKLGFSFEFYIKKEKQFAKIIVKFDLEFGFCLFVMPQELLEDKKISIDEISFFAEYIDFTLKLCENFKIIQVSTGFLD